jgi:hypothetical protein
VLVDLLGPWVVSTGLTWVQFTLVDLIVSLWWTIVTGGALSSISLTILAKITWLASNTISSLSSLGHNTLGLKWAWDSNSGTSRAVVSNLALITSRVWCGVELWLRAKITSSAALGNDTSTAVITSSTLLTVLVTLIHESTGGANWLTLFSRVTNRLSDTLNWVSLTLSHITIVIRWAG